MPDVKPPHAQETARMYLGPTDARREPAGIASILIDEATLASLVAKVAPGTKITYYVGHLSHDRQPTTQALDAAACRALGVVANRAMRFADAGWAHLVQRRLGPDCWAYILVVRPRRGQVQRAAAVLPLKAAA
jgi:hypothetical protein